MALICLTPALALAQDDKDAEFDAMIADISRRFGAQGRAISIVEQLGGKVQYEKDGRWDRLVGVDLSGTKVSDADLTELIDRLRILPEFSSLDLSETKITDAGLIHLRRFDSLYMLRLARTPMTGAGLSRLLRDLPNLKLARRPRELKYFPSGAITSSLGDFIDDWHSEDLFAMKEPSLWMLSRQDPKAVAYRFRWAPSFHRPTAVRVVVKGESATLYAVQLDGRSGYRGAISVTRRTHTLARAQLEGLRQRFVDARFWSLPAEMRTNGVADGAGYLVEAVEAGRYHDVNANTNHQPDERYRRYMALCEEMIKLSGLDIMEVWKKY